MNSTKFKRFFACVLTAAMFITLTACGGAQKADLGSLYAANTISSILENHDSVYAEFNYYENLDDQVTFKTSYCYSEESADNSLYVAEGYDTSDEESSDNFSYCITDNLEYFMDYDGTMNVYPLTSEYLSDFKENSITVYNSDYETVSSVENSGSNVILTSEAKMSDVYSSDTLSSLESLCGDTLSTIRYVYTANKSTLLLNSVKVYYIAEDSTEYLFSDETVSYDTEKPSTDFADAYINSQNTRSITVVEKKESGDVTNIYTIPAAMTPDFQCFQYYYGYTIYNDPDGIDQFTQETPDDSGNYANVTFYALPTPTDAESTTSGGTSISGSDADSTTTGSAASGTTALNDAEPVTDGSTDTAQQ